MTDRDAIALALRALKLGDFLTGIPALRALRASLPDHELVLLAPRWLEPLVAHVDVVDRLVHLPGLVALPLEVHRADIAIDLHGCGPESQRCLLGAQPRQLIAFRHPHVPETKDMPTFSPQEHEVARWCRLLAESGIPADPANLSIEAPHRTGCELSPGTVLVHPGAASAARRWPAERFAKVIAALRGLSHRIIVTAGPREELLAREVAERAGLEPTAIRSGIGLLDLAALVANAAYVLCGDTGIAHLSFALGTPSVVLYGPVPPHRWGPPPNDGRHLALWAGRVGDPHGSSLDPGLFAITVRQVLDAFESLCSDPPVAMGDGQRSRADRRVINAAAPLVGSHG